MPKVKDVPKNSGKVLDVDGQRLAVVNTDGKLQAFSSVCPHMGCEIDWNDGENTWDCPCHGSRFESDGTLKNGPAKHGLDPVEIKTDGEDIKLV